jgi:hypothetical protein
LISCPDRLEIPPRRRKRLCFLSSGGDLNTTMIQGADLLAETLRGDKDDTFLHDSTRDSI